jgi:hypothetical protein
MISQEASKQLMPYPQPELKLNQYEIFEEV